MNMTEKFEWGSKRFANVSKFLHVFFIFNIFEVFLRSGYLELLHCNISMTLTPKLWLNHSLTLLFLVGLLSGLGLLTFSQTFFQFTFQELFIWLIAKSMIESWLIPKEEHSYSKPQDF